MAAPEEHGAEAAGVFPPFDPQYFGSQLFWLAISFGVLYLALSRFLLPRLSQILEERRDKIADDRDEAERLSEEAKAAVASYELALADARAKAHKIAGDARAKVDAEIAAEAIKIDEEIATRNADADARINEAKAAAITHIDSIASETAVSLVEKLIGKAPSQSDAEKAIRAVN